MGEVKMERSLATDQVRRAQSGIQPPNKSAATAEPPVAPESRGAPRYKDGPPDRRESCCKTGHKAAGPPARQDGALAGGETELQVTPASLTSDQC